MKFVSPDISSGSEGSDEETEEKAFMVNNQKKFYKNKYNSGSKYNKFNKFTGDSEKKNAEGSSDGKKELTGDSGYDCNFCNGKNHLARDCMFNKKKERERMLQRMKLIM